jgi:hypothetical protein
MIGMVMRWRFESFIAGEISRAEVTEEWRRRVEYAERVTQRFGYYDNPNYPVLCDFMAHFLVAPDDKAARALCVSLFAENGWKVEEDAIAGAAAPDGDEGKGGGSA